MSMSFEEQHALATDDAFRARMEMCMMTVGIQLSQEPTTTPNHESRAALAQRIVDAPIAWGDRGALMVVTDPNISAASSDNDLLSTMYSMLGAITGPTP